MWNLSCIKMHATKNADRCSLIGIVFGRNQESLMWRMTFGVTLGQSANGRIFDKSVGDIVCAWNPSCIKMHATTSYYIKPPKSAVDFNNVLNVRKIHRTLFYLPCSVQLVARNQESLMWRMTFGVIFGKPTNGRVFDKSVGDIVCGVESIVHQDARYHALIY